MKYLLNKLTFSTFLVSTLIVTGCGGGGGDSSGAAALTYTGNTSPAAVSASNAEEIGTAAANATTETIQNSEMGDAIPFGVAVTADAPDSIRQQVNSNVKHIWDDLKQDTVSVAGVIYTAEQLNELASQESGQTIDWFCGGSMDVPSNPNATSGTMTFYDLCFDLGEPGTSPAIMNGSVSFTFSQSGDNWTETTTYSNFTVTMNGETYSLSGTQTCSYNSGNYSCADLFTGDDGQTYQVADSSYYGDPVSGYYFNATFYHPSFGSVEVSTTSAITFNCGNRIPDSGAISFTGTGGSSGTVIFNDCMSYTVTFDDGAGNAGTIDGTW